MAKLDEETADATPDAPAEEPADANACDEETPDAKDGE